MEKKYIIVRLDNNTYWGRGYWEEDVKLAQYFDEPTYPTRRVSEGDLYERDSIGLPVDGKVFEVREVWVNKNYEEQ